MADRIERKENAALRRRHGDHRIYSITRWRGEQKAGLTDLEYVDWRADKKWCAADDMLSARQKGGA